MDNFLRVIETIQTNMDDSLKAHIVSTSLKVYGVALGEILWGWN